MSSRSSALITNTYVHDKFWRLTGNYQTCRVTEWVVQNNGVENSDIDHGSIFAVHIDLVELVQVLEALYHVAEDGVLAVESCQRVISQSYEELGFLKTYV